MKVKNQFEVHMGLNISARVEVVEANGREYIVLTTEKGLKSWETKVYASPEALSAPFEDVEKDVKEILRNREFEWNQEISKEYSLRYRDIIKAIEYVLQAEKKIKPPAEPSKEASTLEYLHRTDNYRKDWENYWKATEEIKELKRSIVSALHLMPHLARYATRVEE